jgi:hypothetical protein
MAKYRVVKKCYHNKFWYNTGDPYSPTPEELRDGLPDSFVKEKEFTAEAVEKAEEEDRGLNIYIVPQKAGQIPAVNAAKKPEAAIPDTDGSGDE